MRARQGARGFVAGRVHGSTQPKQNANATKYCDVYAYFKNATVVCGIFVNRKFLT